MKLLRTMFSSSSARGRAIGLVAAVMAGLGFAGAVQARDNVSFSVQFGSPAYAYPVYTQPQVVYVQPQPVYVQPAPVYVQPAPVYYQAPQVIYRAPQPVTYGYPGLYPNVQIKGHGYGHGWNKHKGGYYVQQGARYAPGYAPIYYRR